MIFNDKYNGWENYETWNVVLMLQNDQYLYNVVCQVLKKGNKFHNGSIYENVIIEADLANKKTLDEVDYCNKNVNRKEINEHLLGWEEAGAFSG